MDAFGYKLKVVDMSNKELWEEYHQALRYCEAAYPTKDDYTMVDITGFEIENRLKDWLNS